MHKIREMLMEELKKYEGKGISTGSLDVMHKLTDTIKNIDKIEMLEGEEGYSEARGGDWEARGSYGREYGYSRDASYNEGNSYARRGRHYVRGHYSRDGGSDMHSYRSEASYDDGMKDITERLEEMMEHAGNDKEREAIRHCISRIRS